MEPDKLNGVVAEFVSTELAERRRLESILEELHLEPKTKPNVTIDALVDRLMLPHGFNTRQFIDFVNTNFKNASAITPKNLDPFYPPRTYNRINTNGQNEIKFLSAEYTLERAEKMLDEAVEAVRKQHLEEHPLKIHLHILSVLDSDDPKDKAKIDNVDAIKNFVLATYKSRYPGVDLQMRDKNGNLLSFDAMDGYLKAYRDQSKDGTGVHQVYNIHCRAGQGRSATVMICEDIRYNGLLPSDSSDQIKASRKGARGIKEGAFRPDQMCFIYSYFFHSAAEALKDSNSNPKIADKLGSIKLDSIASLIDEMKWALSIDYGHRLDNRGNANVSQWASKLTKSFLEFRAEFKRKKGIDVLDQLLIDYAKDPSEYSEAQKQNLGITLAAAGYPALDKPDTLIEVMNAETSEKSPSQAALRALAIAMVRNAEPLTFWEWISPFTKRKPMPIQDNQLKKLCTLGRIKSEELPLSMQSYAQQPATQMTAEKRQIAIEKAQSAIAERVGVIRKDSVPVVAELPITNGENVKPS